MSVSQAALDQAELLQILAEKIMVKRRLWTRQERTDARILVGLLIEHSLTAERKAAEAVG